MIAEVALIAFAALAAATVVILVSGWKTRSRQ